MRDAVERRIARRAGPRSGADRRRRSPGSTVGSNHIGTSRSTRQRERAGPARARRSTGPAVSTRWSRADDGPVGRLDLEAAAGRRPPVDDAAPERELARRGAPRPPGARRSRGRSGASPAAPRGSRPCPRPARGSASGDGSRRRRGSRARRPWPPALSRAPADDRARRPARRTARRSGVRSVVAGLRLERLPAIPGGRGQRHEPGMLEMGEPDHPRPAARRARRPRRARTAPARGPAAAPGRAPRRPPSRAPRARRRSRRTSPSARC